MKLFKAALGSKEQDKALSREKFFKDEFGSLASDWNKRLISSGMEPSQVYESAPGNEGSSRYSPEQEHQFSTYARWLHKADASRFQVGRSSNIDRNRQIWNLFANGFTVREIGKELDLDFRRVNETVSKLQERCHEDVRLGLLEADKDSRQEINDWTRLQAIRDKHLTMLRNGTLAETIADSVLESGCLIKLPLDNDIVEAFNEATAQIALALEVEVDRV